MLRPLALGLAVLVSVASGTQAAEQKAVTLTLSQGMPATDPLQLALENWTATMHDASNGSLRFTIVPEQPGKAAEQYDAVREGKTDMALIEPANDLARFPIVIAAALPFLIAHAKGGTAAVDEWYRAYAAREMKEVKFCLAFVQEPGTLHARGGKIVIPKNLAGLRVRVPNAMMNTLVSRLGGTADVTAETATRQLLEGGADAALAPWDSVTFFGFDGAVKYHLDAPVYVSPFVLVINKARFAALSQAQKYVIDAYCSTPWAVRIAAPLAEASVTARLKLQAMPGHAVYTLTPEQIDAWREATRTLQESWALNARRAGIDPDAAMADLKDLLAKYKAAF